MSKYWHSGLYTSGNFPFISNWQTPFWFYFFLLFCYFPTISLLSSLTSFCLDSKLWNYTMTLKFIIYYDCVYIYKNYFRGACHVLIYRSEDSFLELVLSCQLDVGFTMELRSSVFCSMSLPPSHLSSLTSFIRTELLSSSPSCSPQCKQNIFSSIIHDSFKIATPIPNLY